MQASWLSGTMIPSVADATLYLAYARTNNADKVNFSANGQGHGDKVFPDFGNDPNAISLGFVAKFTLDFPL